MAKCWLGVLTVPPVSVRDLLEFGICLCSLQVYNKLVVTALKYTPVVLEHHVSYKTLPNGKLYFFFFYKRVELIHGIFSKAPTQTQKFKTLQKLILSFFSNITHIISQLTDEDTLRLAITESAKLVPYIINSRKAVKLYLKVCALPFIC